MSAGCISTLFQLMLVLSNLGGVPVFNLPIGRLNALIFFDKWFDGFSPILPACILSFPIWITPPKKVPVVNTTDLAFMERLLSKTTFLIILFSIVRSFTIPSKIVRFAFDFRIFEIAFL